MYMLIFIQISLSLIIMKIFYDNFFELRDLFKLFIISKLSFITCSICILYESTLYNTPLLEVFFMYVLAISIAHTVVRILIVYLYLKYYNTLFF